MQTTNLGTEKINDTTLETYEMMVAAFLMTNQTNKVKFFEEIFLVANVSLKVILKMPFLTLSSADVDFPKR